MPRTISCHRKSRLRLMGCRNAPPSVGSGKARLICGFGLGALFAGGGADVGDLFEASGIARWFVLLVTSFCCVACVAQASRPVAVFSFLILPWLIANYYLLIASSC